MYISSLKPNAASEKKYLNGYDSQGTVGAPVCRVLCEGLSQPGSGGRALDRHVNAKAAVLKFLNTADTLLGWRVRSTRSELQPIDR